MLPTSFDVLLLGGFATYYVTFCFVAADGPWEIFARIRDAVGVGFDKESNPYALTEIAKIFICPVCFSFYPATFFVILFLLLPSFAIYLMLPFAIAGLTVVLGKLGHD